jgi:hypothetical protein
MLYFGTATQLPNFLSKNMNTVATKEGFPSKVQSLVLPGPVYSLLPF